MSNVRFVIEPGKVTRQVDRSPTTAQVAGEAVKDRVYVDHDSKPIGEVFRGMGESTDTGLMPPGVRMFTQIGSEVQVVVEIPPGINRICVSDTEGEARYGSYEQYLVAQPWRVIIARYRGGNMVGARNFYRLRPIYSLDDELLHTNLANVNCLGYNNTAVGWICFYGDKFDNRDMSWPERLHRLIERVNGGEVYSLANMRSIDGPGFYRKASATAKRWRSNARLWEEQTDKKGLDLAMSEDAWLPVLVTDEKHQNAHDENGKPLTLGAALSGIAPMAYGDHGQFPSPKETDGTSYARQRHDLFNVLSGAYNKAAAKEKKA